MRIVGGKLSGRKIEPPLSRTTRPMMDRIRQALFNILEHHEWGPKIGDVLDGAHILDAFCGTGALAYEAVSRGGLKATLFDKDAQALSIAKKNAETLGITKQCAIMTGDALAPPKSVTACKLVFLAPPYRKNLIPPAMIALDRAGWMAPYPLIVAETAKKEFLELPENFVTLFPRYYADTALHFVVRA